MLTAPTDGFRHALHRASALTEELTHEVLDLALEPPRVLYLQTHIPPAGTSNRLGRLGLQCRVEAAHPAGVSEQWLTFRNPSTAQGHWYLHQLLFLPRAAPEHRRQNPYHTHPERLGAQSFLQLAPPALPPGQGLEALHRPPPPRHSHHGTAKGKQRPGRGRTGLHELRSSGLDGGLQVPRPRYHGAQTVQTARRLRPRSRPSPWDPWRRGQRNCCPASPGVTRSPASQPQRTRRRHPSRRSS